MFSSSTPYITTNTLTAAQVTGTECSLGADNTVHVTKTLGVTSCQVSFSGVNFASGMQVFYSSSSYSDASFEATVASFTPSDVTVQLPSTGCGCNLAFFVKVGTAGSLRSNFRVCYPAPIINDVSLHRPGQVASASLSEPLTSSGEDILFTATNLGPKASLISVRYGPDSNPLRFSCSVDSTVTSDATSTVRCSTEQGEGKLLRFTVIVAGQSSAVGNDRYNYPDVPVVTSVTGCPTADSLGTANCPTEGKTIITITGSGFEVRFFSLFFSPVVAWLGVRPARALFCVPCCRFLLWSKSRGEIVPPCAI